MTANFHFYNTVVVNSDLVNRKTFQIEEVNVQNITKNNVEPQKSALKLLRGTNKVQNGHSGKFFLFFNPQCRLIEINIEGQWKCSIIAKIFTVTQVLYTITKLWNLQ